MAHQYAKIAFTPTIRQVQAEQNSRQGYASMDTGEDYNYVFSAEERDFIAQRDSFYMASVSETDWPYVQHRGGPKGFLKVIDEQTLGFADYKGNRQYISTGNFRGNDKVSIILMDYANRRRLKIIGRIALVDEHDWEKLASLEDDHYRASVERGFIIKVVAFDWNCPQHITPRYSESEISALTEPLEAKIKRLTEQNKQYSNTSQIKNHVLGQGDFPVIITGIRQLTPDIRAYELRSAEENTLPKITAGAHIQVPVQLPSGEHAWRSYSISSNPSRTDCYEIAVKLEEKGDGGSLAVHQQYQLGLTLHCKKPQNFFALEESNQEQNQHSVLIAAGIGITPIKSMALALLKQKKSFELHYAGRSESSMAYADRLSRQLAEKLYLYPSQAGVKLSVEQLIIDVKAQHKENTQYYFCGPHSMLKALKKYAQVHNIPTANIHYEQFSTELDTSNKSCELVLTQSNLRIQVKSDETLLESILAAGVPVPYSCKTGLCKSCVVQVSPEDNIQHRDKCLTEGEKSAGKMCLCVSRPQTNRLSIDL